ncbi:hypothetical protein PG999_000503 [Apiospora kogelbergensis]|uniref:Zn(2)-C6 fungal-type domain-containing protein n=1 Tax=Apiospora kogelbergensis TaxID=1337665 RepID=A0AAW0RBQ7_9PEZI
MAALPMFVRNAIGLLREGNDLLRRHLQRHVETVANGKRGVARACEACHSNKTRCVGGTPCSLCVKRGITCCLAKKAPQHEVATSTQIPQKPASPSHSPRTEKRAGSRAGSSLDPVQMIGMMSVRGEEEQSDPTGYVEYMREILRVQGPEEAIHRILSDGRSRSLSLLRQPSRQFENFAEEHLETYLKTFHDAWPFLHSITLDLPRDDLRLVASVIIIGILLKGDAQENSRSKALACHEVMMSHSTIEQWPMEWYQALLLNIIIGIFRKEMSRSRLLCSLFIAHLRLVGVFDPTVAEAQTKNYRPGNFLPFVLANIEQRSRLIAYLFKADALLSLLDGQPPMLHSEELDTQLPQTFSMWNAYGLNVFYKRYEDEPSHRASHRLNEFVSSPFRFTTGSIVVEDVEFGLWALAGEVWQHGQRRLTERKKTSDTTVANTTTITTNDNTQSALLHRLRGWKHQLNGLQRLCSSGATTGEEAENALRLIRAYRGDDDELPNEEWQTLARNRAIGRVREAMNLHDILELHLHDHSNDIGTRSITLVESLDMGP